jgi:hypothetical protein
MASDPGSKKSLFFGKEYRAGRLFGLKHKKALIKTF